MCGLVVAAMLPACSSGGTPATVTPDISFRPVREATAGDALLDQLPPGAEVLVELDLARLRGNAVVGEMARALLAAPPEAGDADGAGTVLADAMAAPLAGADAVVLAAYRVGTPAATTITIVQGGAPGDGAIELGDGRWALAVEGDVAAILEAASDDGDDLRDDAALLTTRAWAMPAGADGASLRITARLPGPARAALADALGVDDAPGALSVWGDVADDLAIVARLADEPGTPAARGRAAPPWLPAVRTLRDRIAALPELGALGLARPIADADIRRDDGGVRVAVVIAPGRLRRAAQRWSVSRGAEP
jgi:hypothetical protein